MKMTWSWKKRLWHVLAIGLVLLILYLLVGRLHFAMFWFSHAVYDYYQQEQTGYFPEPGHYCADHPLVQNLQETFVEFGSPLTRTMVLSASPAGLQLDFKLSVPYEHALTNIVARGILSSPDSDLFVCGTFGEIWVNQQWLGQRSYSVPAWSIDPATGTVDIQLQAYQPIPEQGVWIELIRPFTASIPAAGQDQVIINLADYQLQYIDPLPEQTTPQLVLTNAYDRSLDRVTIFLSRPASAQATVVDTAAAQPAPETRRGFLQRLGRALSEVDLLSSLLLAVLEALPLFIFWYLVLHRRQGASSLVASLVRTTIVLLLFHFIVITVTSSSSIFYNVWNIVLGWLRAYAVFPGDLNLEPYWVVPIIISVLVPGLLWQKRVLPLSLRKRPAAWWRYLLSSLFFLLLLLGVALAVFFIWQNLADYQQIFVQVPDEIGQFLTLFWPLYPSADLWLQGNWLILVTCGLALLIWGVLRILYSQLALQPPRAGLIALAVFLVVILAALEQYGRVIPPTRGFGVLAVIWLVVATGLSAFQVVALGAVVWAQVQKLRQRQIRDFVKTQAVTEKAEAPPVAETAPPAPTQPPAALPRWLQVLLMIPVFILALLRPGQRPEQPQKPLSAGQDELSSMPAAPPPAVPPQEWSVPRWGWATLILLAVLFSIPMITLFQREQQLVRIYDVVSMAYRLDNLILFIWIGGVLWLLYLKGRAVEPELAPFTRTVGILAASSLLFSPTAHWLYIPIRFLLGWYLLSRLVKPVAHWQTLRHFFKKVVTERQDLLDQIVDLNMARSAYQQFRKNLNEKLSKGEKTFTEYDAELEARKQELTQLHQKSCINQRPAKEVALTFGPYPSAWQNGVHGAKWALLFATPWILLFLRNFFNTTVDYSIYPLWQFAIEFMNVAAGWAVFGFVFGYFYPYLRGENGLQKGLGLFGVAVVPWLPLMILYNATTAEWQASLFWMLQVFIHCMLLGLVAFDYVVLRQGGYYNWQMLFEVHGMTYVGFSVATILAAIGTTLTALLTSQATTLVTLALGFILPEVQQLPTPPPLPTPTPGP